MKVKDMDTVLLSIVENSNSLLKSFLDAFVNGIRHSGNKIFSFNILDFQIMDCQGCTEDIFFQPNGSCKCEDDFTSIYPYLQKSQFLVFGLDLDFPETLKELDKVLLRMEPLFPAIINGTSELSSKKLFAILFSRLNISYRSKVDEHIEEFANLYNYEYLGSIHRTQYNLLERLPVSIAKSFAFEDDFSSLGLDLITTGKVNISLKERIERNLLPEDSLFREFLPLIGGKY